MVGRPTLRSGSGREALLQVESGQETLPEVQEWSRGPPLDPGVVERASRRFGSG